MATKVATPKKKDILKHKSTERWFLVNAENQVLGRLAVGIATVLIGKDRTDFQRTASSGTHVVVVNAGKIRVTGEKQSTKLYKRYSGYQGGLRLRPLERVLKQNPREPIYHAVKGMLPKNSLGYGMLKRLTVYSEPNHPHAAQRPVPLNVE